MSPHRTLRLDGPRALLRGVRQAAGVVIDEQRLGAARARARVLDAWEPGARLYRCEAGLVLMFQRPVELDARYAAGALVIEHGAGLTTAPIAGDAAETGLRPDDLLGLHQGHVFAARLDVAHALDPAEWIDPGAFTLASALPWPEPTGEPTLVAPPPAREIKHVIGSDIPDLDPSTDALIKAGERASRSSWWSAFRSSFGRAAAAPAGALAGLAAGLGRAFEFLGGGLRRGGAGGQAGSPGLDAGRGASAPPPRRPLASWLFKLAERFALTNALGGLEARFLRKLVGMIERGDVERALRHALPLNSRGENLGPGFDLSWLRPRSTFEIKGLGTSYSSLLSGVESVHAYLDKQYRRMAQHLEAQGKIERAAWVYAELIGDAEEAVQVLERGGKLREAAEVAEKKELAPGLIVRLWFQAGEVERALAIARRTHAFADAIVRIEKTRPEDADRLRLLWADLLASGGDYAQAVEVAWKVEAASQLLRAWLRRGIEVGGEAASRLIVRNLILAPEDLDALLPTVEALLSDRSSEGATDRLALANALLDPDVDPDPSGDGRLPPALRAIARMTCRTLVREAGDGRRLLTRARCRNLALRAGDRALADDLPTLDEGAPVETPLELRFSASNVGTLPVHDALALPRGRTLVALGETGVVLLARDGRVIAHFDEPATDFVASDSGAWALALARRGERVRMARIHCDVRRAEPWGELMLDGWAPTTDGNLWFAYRGNVLHGIDVVSEKPEALWRVSEVGDTILGVARSADEIHVLTCEPLEDAPEPEAPLELARWTYRASDLRLTERTTFKPSGEGEIGSVGIYERGHVLIVPASGSGGRWELFRPRGTGQQIEVPVEGGVLQTLLTSRFVVAASKSTSGAHVRIVEPGHADWVVLKLEGAADVGVRAYAKGVVVWDDRGRVVRVDLERPEVGEVVRV